MGILLAALAGSIAWSAKRRLYAGLSWLRIAVFVSPGVLMAASFYALAIHMRIALGGWPTSIGEAGFPPSLVTHGNTTFGYFTATLLATVFVWPAALGVCAAVSRWRRHIAEISLFGASVALGFALMMAGPSQFLYWWWD